jgi:hypothetical protein
VSPGPGCGNVPLSGNRRPLPKAAASREIIRWG